jgi:TonB family protein
MKISVTIVLIFAMIAFAFAEDKNVQKEETESSSGFSVPEGSVLSSSESNQRNEIEEEQITLDETPKLITRVLPDYPELLKEKNIQGYATVQFIVIEDGTVDEARVVRTNEELFGEAAVKAIKQCVFTIPKVDGKPIRVRFTMTMPFRLND